VRSCTRRCRARVCVHAAPQGTRSADASRCAALRSRVAKPKPNKPEVKHMCARSRIPSAAAAAASLTRASAALRSNQAASALFFTHNTALGPPYRVLVDTNFINFSIKNKARASRVARPGMRVSACTP
jgi:hypothetical protein